MYAPFITLIILPSLALAEKALNPRQLIPIPCSEQGLQDCGTDCISLSATCCADGSGGCPVGTYCTLRPNGRYGCCEDGQVCVGPGGANSGGTIVFETTIPGDTIISETTFGTTFGTTFETTFGTTFETTIPGDTIISETTFGATFEATIPGDTIISETTTTNTILTVSAITSTSTDIITEPTSTPVVNGTAPTSTLPLSPSPSLFTGDGHKTGGLTGLWLSVVAVGQVLAALIIF